MLRTLAIAAAVSASLALAGCGKKAADPVLIEANAAVATAYMEKTAKEPGVKALPSGVLYRIVRPGDSGGVSPRPEDEVKVHYEGKLVSGDVFDSSYQKGAPAVMKLGGLIPAWVEALQKMKPGEEWILYVPPALGYGEQGAGPIPPNSVLIFRIELLGVLPAAGSTGFGR
ncbi:MAG: FKBP-type peptidyl-prolyl cis-trans isomerase [Caulobacter sp.]|nr:FKBP-type peptidyl-prolyl cis-trans isomerase [Caulobacter sp.]